MTYFEAGSTRTNHDERGNVALTLCMLLTVAIAVLFIAYLLHIRSDARTRIDMHDSAEDKYGVTIKVLDNGKMSIDGKIRECVFGKDSSAERPKVLCEGAELVASKVND